VRFWYVDGVLGMSLAEVVPKVVNRRAALQQALPPAQVRALLASCDLRRPAGRRDFAVLMLLARMGLRSGEVAGLQLADIATVSDGSARRHRTPHEVRVSGSCGRPRFRRTLICFQRLGGSWRL
jgi:integrase